MKKTKKEFRKNKKQRNLLSKFSLIFKKSSILLLVLAGAMLFLLIFALAQPGHETTMNLQGKAFDSNGDPVDNKDLEVNISSASNCNGDIYSNTFTNEIQNSFFNVDLGPTNLDLEYNKDYYLCLTIDPVGGGLAIGPTAFRGGQGQITEEDIDIYNLSVGGNITLGNNAEIQQSTLGRLLIPQESIMDNILPRSGGKTLGNLANIWSTIFARDVNATNNVEVGNDLYFPAGAGNPTIYIDNDIALPWISVRSRGASSERSAFFAYAYDVNQDAQIAAVASNGNKGFIGGWSAGKSTAYVSSGDGADLYFGMGRATEDLIPMNASSQDLGNSTNQWAELYVDNFNVTNNKVVIGESGSSACMQLRDSDDAGWSYCTLLDGSMSCSTTPC